MGNRIRQGAKELIEEYFKKIAEIHDEECLVARRNSKGMTIAGGGNIRGQDKGPLGRRLSQQEEKEGRTK